MANPFAKFRKNQKKWIAFLAVLCMVTFVLGYAGMELLAFFFSGGGQGPDVAVKTKVASLGENELGVMMQRRNQLNRFMFSITFGHGERQQMIPQFGLSNRSFATDNPIYGVSEAKDMFDTWLKAQKAMDMGIEVTDKAINAFLERESNPTLTKTRFDELLGQLQPPMSEQAFFEAMRIELLARRLEDMLGMDVARLSVYGVPLPGSSLMFIPSERKEIWDKLNRRAHAEVLAVPVEEFVGLVAEPKDNKQLTDFFDNYKDLLPRDESRFPGFKRPGLAQFQFFRLISDRFAEAARAVVTDAEMRERYDEETKKPDSKHKFNSDAFREEIEKERKKRKAEEKEEKKKAKSGAKSDGSGAGLGPRGAGEVESRRPRLYPVAFQKSSPEKAKDGGSSDKKKPAGKEAAKKEAAKKEAGPMTVPESAKPKRKLQDILDVDLKIPDDIAAGANPKIKPFWQVENDIRNDLASDQAKKDLTRLRELLKERMDAFGTQWGEWSGNEPKLGSAKWLAWQAREPANPLNDPREVQKTVADAWNALLAEKKKAWTESFENRKKFVEGEITRIAEEKDVEKARKALKQKADKEKNEDWLKLLAEAEQLADVAKAVEEVAKKWSGQLAVAEPFAAPQPGEPFEPAWTFETTDAGSLGRGLSQQEFEKRDYAIEETFVDRAGMFLQVSFQRPPLYRPRLASASSGDDQFLFWTIAKRHDFTPLHWSKQDVITLGNGKQITGHIKRDDKNGVVILPQNKANDEDSLVTLKRRKIKQIKWADDFNKDSRPIERDEVVRAWKLIEARKEASESANALAKRIRAASQGFPISETARLFKIDGFNPFAPVELDDKNDWPHVKFTAKEPEGKTAYRVVVERFANGKRSAVSRRNEEPHWAPPPTLAGHRRQAEGIAAEMKDPDVLVIIGRLVGESLGDEIYRGVIGVRWDAKQEKAVAWPGVIDGREFQLGTAQQAKKSKGEPKTATGTRLEPLSYVDVDDAKQLKFAGTGFAEALFNLRPGEVAVAMNQPRNVAYVIQATDFDYSLQGVTVPDSLADDMRMRENPIADAFAKDQRRQLSLELALEQNPNLLGQNFLGQDFQRFQRFRQIQASRRYQGLMDALYKEYVVELNWKSSVFKEE